MWDMLRNLVPDPLPPGRCTIQFQYPELPPPKQNWWLVVDGGKVDLCSFDPGFEIDLLVTSSLRTMTAIWMGLSAVRREFDAGNVALDGDRAVANAMQRWLGLSMFAAEPRRVQRSEEHTSELQSLMRISYAVFCLKKKNKIQHKHNMTTSILEN